MMVWMSTCILLLSNAVAQIGQNQWCYVPPNSSQMFCDYISYSSCMDANRNERGGACIYRPRS